SALPAAIPRRNYSTVLTRSCHAIEHAPSSQRDVADRLFSVTLAPQIGRHHAKDIRAFIDKDYARIVAYSLKRPGFIGNLQIVGQVARNPAVFMRSQHFEEVIGHLLIQNLSLIESLE